jgi:hypothetical protein
MPEQLLKAVQELTATVGRLESTLKEYPKRQEVEARFETKRAIKSQRKKMFYLGIAILVGGLLTSYFVTVTTITSCFVSDSARAGEASVGCSLLPGYSEAQRENQQLIKELRVLLNQPETNSKRLDRLEEHLGLPPLPDEGN